MIVKVCLVFVFFFFFQAEDGIRDLTVTGVQTCALPISSPQGCQCTGWWAADFKYAEGSVARRLAIAGNLHPRARTPPVHHALLAPRPPRDADLAPVLNQGV